MARSKTHLLLAFTAPFALTACPDPSHEVDALAFDVTAVDNGPSEPTGTPFCTATTGDVPGAVIPAGFCMRRFAAVGEARSMVFASNGDLFVSSPSASAPGGASGGAGTIVVLSDDNHDGVAETTTFADNLRDVHGLAIGNGFLYYTTEHNVFRVPFVAGQRHAMAAAEMISTFDTVAEERWTHAMAVSQGGAVYTSQGVHSARMCPDNARVGSIQRIDASGTQLVADGLRNPMYMRCHYADEVCLAAELGDDGGRQWGAREKLLAVHPSTNFGFPCCTSVDVTTTYNDGHFNCSAITHEDATFPLNDTPFGLDWERARWPLPFRDGLFVALHGSYYSSPAWEGARIAFAPTDPSTHLPSGEFRDFVRGFGPGGSPLERPADVAFSPDGRLFMADDIAGAVYWIAPSSLHSPWM